MVLLNFGEERRFLASASFSGRRPTFALRGGDMRVVPPGLDNLAH